MTSPVLSEAYYTGAFLIREANGYLSRDQGSIANASGTDLALSGGLILALATPSTAASAAQGSNTGNGTIGTVTLGAASVPGAYIVNFESATAFAVENPTGQEIGHGTTGSTFSAGGLSFTVTAGGTAFAAGDSFAITVSSATPNNFVPYTPSSGPAAAILYNRTVVPATSTKKITAITRLAEINVGEVQWDASVTGAGNVAALQASALASLSALGLVFRANATSAG